MLPKPLADLRAALDWPKERRVGKWGWTTEYRAVWRSATRAYPALLSGCGALHPCNEGEPSDEVMLARLAELERIIDATVSDQLAEISRGDSRSGEGAMRDVLAVDLRTHKVRLLATAKQQRDAEAMVTMAVIRRGVDVEFFTDVPTGTYRDGDKWTGERTP